MYVRVAEQIASISSVIVNAVIFMERKRFRYVVIRGIIEIESANESAILSGVFISLYLKSRNEIMYPGRNKKYVKPRTILSV